MLEPASMLFCLGALVALAAVPLALGKVPPNSWYGFRTPATLSDARTWHLVNRACGRYFIASGLMMIAFGLAMILGAIPAATQWVLLGVLPPVLFAAVGSGIALDRVLAQRKAE
jgi:uncharacterized membrane protein